MEAHPLADQHNSYSYTNQDERSAEDRAIDDWIPIINPRTAKWWHSAVHNITVIVGAGVLGLPQAMAHLGWGPGITFLALSWIITLFTLWQMVEMHEIEPGQRCNTYHELGQHAFGQKLGLWIVVPQQLIVVIGVDIVYMITGGTCLRKFYNLVCEGCRHMKLTYFIMIFASVHFVLSQSPGLSSIVRISLAAAVMSLSYCTIAWGTSLHKGVQPDAQYGYKSKTVVGNILSSFTSLGSIVFAHGGHNVVMEIQATMPSTPENPSKRPMFWGVIVAYIIVALCYFPVALIGYWIFGNQVDENILVALQSPKWLIAMANMFVVVHLIGGYQIFAMPFFEMMEIVLVTKLKFRPTWYLRFISRNVYVAFTMFIAITFPFFGAILGFVGGFAFAPSTYFLPCIIWLAIHKPHRFSLSWFINWVCIIFGALLTIVGPIGGLRHIILKFNT